MGASPPGNRPTITRTGQHSTAAEPGSRIHQYRAGDLPVPSRYPISAKCDGAHGGPLGCAQLLEATTCIVTRPEAPATAGTEAEGTTPGEARLRRAQQIYLRFTDLARHLDCAAGVRLGGPGGWPAGPWADGSCPIIGIRTSNAPPRAPGAGARAPCR